MKKNTCPQINIVYQFIQPTFKSSFIKPMLSAAFLFGKQGQTNKQTNKQGQSGFFGSKTNVIEDIFYMTQISQVFALFLKTTKNKVPIPVFWVLIQYCTLGNPNDKILMNAFGEF